MVVDRGEWNHTGGGIGYSVPRSVGPGVANRPSSLGPYTPPAPRKYGTKAGRSHA